MVSSFTKSISISVPHLDFRRYTVDYWALVLIMYSDWKKVYSRCPSSMIFEFFFSFVFSLHSIIRYSNYYAFIYNQGHMRTMESLAWRDFKGRKPFDSLRQMMHVALVFTTEITGYMMFVNVEGLYEAFENCHYSLYIQLNPFPY